MKNQEELRLLARMALDGSARIVDVRRMAELVLAEDAPEDGEDHSPVGQCADGSVITLREWLRRAFASGSPGAYPSWRYEGYAIGDRFDDALGRGVADHRHPTPPQPLDPSRQCGDPEDHYLIPCELERGHGGSHWAPRIGLWPRAIGGR